MNKFVNILLLLISMPVIALTLFVGFDLPLEFLKTSGANIPYRFELFMAFGTIILLIGARRSIRRWMGIKMVSQVDRFQWNVPMAKGRYQQAFLYLVIEAVVHLFVGLSLYLITPLVWPVSLVLVLLSIDHLAFGIIAGWKQLYRVGITPKAILVADRDVKAIYFTGLRQISVHQQSLFFDYIKELQLSIPIDCIEPESRASFRDQITENIDRNRVFYSESFKDFS